MYLTFDITGDITILYSVLGETHYLFFMDELKLAAAQGKRYPVIPLYRP